MIRLFTAAWVLLLVGLSARIVSAQVVSYVYVPSTSTGNISVIDPVTNTVVDTFTITGLSQGVAVTPDGSKLYATIRDSNTVSVLDALTGVSLSPDIPVGSNPSGILAAPDGTALYVANRNSNTLSKIDVATNTVVSTIPGVNSPAVLALTSDGGILYISNQLSNTVSYLSTATDTLGAPIPVGVQPIGLALSPDATTLYVVNVGSNNVNPIATATNTVGAATAVGNTPVSAAFGNGGAYLFVSVRTDDVVRVIDTATQAVIATIPVGSSPFGVSASGDGSLIYVTNGNSDSVSVIDASTLAVVATIAVGDNPAPLGIFTGPSIITGTLSVEDDSALNAFGFNRFVNFNGGTLRLAGDWITSRSVSLLPEGGTIDTNGFNAVINGAIINGGALTKTGDGALILTKNNTYTGGTNILGGLIEFSSGGNFGTGTITLNGGGLRWASGASLDISSRLNPLGAGGGIFDTNGNNVTLASSLSGSGGLTKQGAGALVLSASNTYSGGTTITGGFIEFSRGDNLGIGNVQLNGGGLRWAPGVSVDLSSRLDPLGAAGGIFDTNGNDVIFASALSGRGGIVKQGAGALTLTGSNRYRGVTTVSAGELILGRSGTEASLSGDVIVREGASFSGSGTVGGDLTLRGALGPGHSPGSLNIGGDFTLRSTALLVIEIASSTRFDKLTIGGVARLGGTLRISILGGFEPEEGETFAILSSRDAKGEFAAIEQPAGAEFQVVLSGGRLLLVWGEIPERKTYQSYALSSNQYNAAAALERFRTKNIGSNSDFEINIRPALDALAPAELRQAFEAITPVQSMAFSETTFARSKAWLPQMTARLADIRAGSTGFHSSGFRINERGAADMKDVLAPTPENKWGVWVDGSGIFNETASFENLGSGSGASAAGTAGADYRVTENLTLGLYAGYIGSWTDFGNNSEVNSNGGRIGLYSTYRNGGFYLNNLVGGEFHTYDWKRNIAFPGVNRNATADTDGQVFETMFGGGHDWTIGENLTLGLFGAVEYTLLFIDGFTEQGAGALNLRIDDQDADSLRTNVGAQVLWNIPAGAQRFRPSARIAWRHEYLDGNRRIGSALAGGTGPGFSTMIPGGNRQDSLLVNGGFSLDLAENVTGYIYYTGDIAGGATDNIHALNAGLRVEF